MKGKIGKLLFIPILGLLTFAISCEKSADPNPPAAAVYGCKDAQAINYNKNATIDDKSCYYVATGQLPANAVIELYTGVRSNYSPAAQAMAKTIQTNNPNNVIIVNIHSGPTAIPKVGWPDYTSTYGTVLADSAGMSQPQTSYPGGSVNRYHFSDVPTVAPKKMLSGDIYTALYKDGFMPAASYWVSKISPVNVGIATYWTAASRALKIVVEYYYSSAETNPNYLNVALLENGLVGKQISLNTITGKNDTITSYVQDHVLRTFLTGQWGKSITKTVGSRIQEVFTYTVPTSINIDNCDVAAYICRDIYGKKVYILSGKQTKAKN